MDNKYNNGFLGWLFDAFVLQAFLVAPLTACTVELHEYIYLGGLIFSLGLFVVSILYHARWKYRVDWISPGEYFIAVKKRDGQKVQTSPFSYHRFALYALMVINLFTTASDYSEILFGQVKFWVVLLITLIFNILMLGGAVLVAYGRWLGLGLISMAILMMAASSYQNFTISGLESDYNSMLRYVAFLLLNVVVISIYLGTKKEKYLTIQDKTTQELS